MKVEEIGIFEAKTGLSELIRKVIEGERFYITRRGVRVAEIRPVEPEVKALTRGCAANADYFMADDFDALPDDFKEYV